MTVTVKDNVVTLTLTTEELATLRGTLDAGVETLASKACYAKVMPFLGYPARAEAAARAERVQKALEHAVQQWVVHG